MIEREPPAFWRVYCDGIACRTEESYDLDDNSFQRVVQMLKDDGWRLKKDRDGDWEHLCQDCANV